MEAGWRSRLDPDPGSVSRACAAAFAVSGMTLAAAVWALFCTPATTWSLAAIMASNPWRATSAGSSLLLLPAWVFSMPARR